MKDVDTDKNGVLDKEETRKYLVDTLTKLGFRNEFSQDNFESIFTSLDTDSSGKIEMKELITFVKKLLGRDD